MNLDQIETKCFILALFIRDDGERFLLGSMAYEFKDSQLHFVGNMYQNDVVEVQGNDGVMLAGQVRRGNTQAFDGYIGDSTVDRQTIEQYRRDFMKFFRKNHYYKVVYVLPDGSAVQRRNGFIVEAPEVKELYQLFPEYHIGINFEDINYYIYEEDSEGEEIYGESATLKIVSSASGGLIWDENSEVSLSGEGVDFTLEGTVGGNVLSDVQLKGDTTQQTYSGKNLLNLATFVKGRIDNGVVGYASDTSSITYTDDSLTFAITANYRGVASDFIPVSPSTQYVFSSDALSGVGRYTDFYDSSKNWISRASSNPATTPASCAYVRVSFQGNSGTGTYTVSKPQFEQGTVTTFEPYVGGIPAPNPSYPQTINTVTGRQVVTISDGDQQSQSYEVNLGKNLFDTTIVIGGIGSTGVPLNRNDRFNTLNKIQVTPNTTYTFSATPKDSSKPLDVVFQAYDSSGTIISQLPGDYFSRLPLTFTTPQNCTQITMSGRYWDDTVLGTVGDVTDTVQNPQLEKGSTATSYAPYFTPIELCKIGTYQDYIYKSGSDWYVHKAIQKLTLGTSNGENWVKSGQSTSTIFIVGLENLRNFSTVTDVNAICVANSFVFNGNSFTDNNRFVISGYQDGSFRFMLFRFSPTSSITDLASFTTWVGNNNIMVYIGGVAPTDTQITNATLIAQLEALASATTYDGSTSFTVDGNGNLAAILAVEVEASGGGGVEWDNYGAVWEEGTGGGPTMIDVDSIDNVYPVWTVTGPAVNPQISVLTTNTTLSYSGTVTASQELKIDMFNKTATLNGASVVGNVSGDWVYLKPGVNRITYTTNNADAPDSTIWWQEIVG